ncbi:MAG: hypothetical protein OEO77_09405, partial [Acidimicrobiia bacterium]|nr:hypothetical protein [Acidimicrobiia bacterium]
MLPVRSADRTWLIAGLALVVACSGSVDQVVTDPAPIPGVATSTTSNGVSGNRYVPGVGAFGVIPALDLEIGEPPVWIVAAPVDDWVAVVVVDGDGVLYAFRIGEDTVDGLSMNLDRLPPGTPPALAYGETVLLLGSPRPSGSALTNPLALSSGGLAFVANDGAVIVSDAAGNRRFEVDALIDGRLAVSGDDRLAVLTSPTDRYGHGVLGDRLEPEQLTVISLVDLTE